MDNKINVLLVEDELILAILIKETLEDINFNITIAHDGVEGLKTFFDIKPDVLVADVMMPEMDGFEMLTKIRQTDKTTPVLFLSARSAIKDVVEGFEIGANDYLRKPFGMQELIIRIKALVNKAYSTPKEETYFQIGNYSFDSSSQKLFYSGIKLDLSHRESEILKRLYLNDRQVINTQNLLLELWGNDNYFNIRSLHVFITKLRHKLSKDKRIRIINVRGIGYKLILDMNENTV